MKAACVILSPTSVTTSEAGMYVLSSVTYAQNVRKPTYGAPCSQPASPQR